MVETRTGSGTYVVEFDFENYLSLASKFFNMGGMTPFVTEFRNHMEIECARLACERAAPGEMDELERLAQEHRQAWLSSGELEHDEWCRRVADTDMAFHEQVIRMAHNPLYVYAFDVAREPIYAYILLSVRKWEPELVQNFRMDMYRGHTLPHLRVHTQEGLRRLPERLRGHDIELHPCELVRAGDLRLSGKNVVMPCPRVGTTRGTKIHGRRPVDLLMLVRGSR